MKKKFHVAIHWDVAFVDDIEAESDTKAIEIAEARALEAPSSDYQWLEKTDVCVRAID